MAHVLGVVFCATFVWAELAVARVDTEELFLVKAPARTVQDRNKIVEAGVALDMVFSDSVSFLATKEDISRVKGLGFKVQVTKLPERNDFPLADGAYHTYEETLAELDRLVATYPAIATRVSLGKSLQGRELAGIRLSAAALQDSLPTAVFVGCHHAREHLSVEVPLMMATYLAKKYGTDARVTDLLKTREVWIVPMVNPDGAEFDVKDGSYKMWRKNRRDNGDGSTGVDLNRNYGGPGFAGAGSSGDSKSDIYHGPSAFSEPETAAVRDFMRARKHATVMLSFHTFSELILWPWGHKADDISIQKDRAVFETMGKKMATWNGYKPEQASDLYLASGDTMDWAYDELKIFGFTFELSPTSFFGGGFYPGTSAIEPTFKENLEPALYLIEKAGNPYEVVEETTADPLGIL